MRFGRMLLLVPDYDEALAFYRDILRFEVLVDMPGPEGLRFVHLSPDGTETGLWLMEPHTEADDKALGRQTGDEPVAVLYTDDCRADAARLAAAGVETGEVVEADGSIHVPFSDPFGNTFVLVEVLGG